jgi:hypothetical protein
VQFVELIADKKFSISGIWPYLTDNVNYDVTGNVTPNVLYVTHDVSSNVTLNLADLNRDATDLTHDVTYTALTCDFNYLLPGFHDITSRFRRDDIRGFHVIISDHFDNSSDFREADITSSFRDYTRGFHDIISGSQDITRGFYDITCGCRDDKSDFCDSTCDLHDITSVLRDFTSGFHNLQVI